MPLEFNQPEDYAQASALRVHLSDLNSEVEPGNLQSAADARTLAHELRTEFQKRRHFHGWSYIMAAACGGVAGAVVAGLTGHGAEVGISPGILCASGCSIIAGARLSRRNRVLYDDVKALALCKEKKASGVFIDLISLGDASLCAIAADGLERLLPSWTEDDLASLSSERRARLRHILSGVVQTSYISVKHIYNTGWHTRLQIALCAMFGRIGDSADERILQQFALLSSKRPVRNAAREAVAEIRARRAAKNMPAGLLRAASAPPIQPAELLRAAAGAARAEEELVRSSDKPGDGLNSD